MAFGIYMDARLYAHFPVKNATTDSLIRVSRNCNSRDKDGQPCLVGAVARDQLLHRCSFSDIGWHHWTYGTGPFGAQKI